MIRLWHFWFNCIFLFLFYLSRKSPKKNPWRTQYLQNIRYFWFFIFSVIMNGLSGICLAHFEKINVPSWIASIKFYATPWIAVPSEPMGQRVNWPILIIANPRVRGRSNLCCRCKPLLAALHCFCVSEVRSQKSEVLSSIIKRNWKLKGKSSDRGSNPGLPCDRPVR